MAGGFVGKRKELEQVVDGLYDFSLSAPAAKSRRLVSASAAAPHILFPLLSRGRASVTRPCSCASGLGFRCVWLTLACGSTLPVQLTLGSIGVAFRLCGSAWAFVSSFARWSLE